MPIRWQTNLPKDVGDFVTRELKSINRAQGIGDNDSGGSQAETPSHALPVYGMPVEGLTRGGREVSLDTAVQCGWRHVDADPQDTIVDYIKPPNASKGVAVVKRGAPAENFKQAAQLAQKDISSSSRSQFEARVLDFGHLGMSELWLYNPDPNVADRFYSLGTKDPHMRTTSEVLDEVKTRVAQQPVSTSAMLADGEDDDLGGGA